MNMKQQWVEQAVELSNKSADIWASSRKIHRNISLRYSVIDHSIKLRDTGYTTSKIKALNRHYLNEESQQVAMELWEHRRNMKSYGSVSFTAFNHYVKGVGSVEEIMAKRSLNGRVSVFGPCIQSLVITYIGKDRYAINAFWRTTEFYKKFPPDIILIRDYLIQPFNFNGLELAYMDCFFANLTCHPMYFVNLICHLKDPICEWERIRESDKRFFDLTVRWAKNYLVPEQASSGIDKFSQALRVQKDVINRIDNLPSIVRYLRNVIKK